MESDLFVISGFDRKVRVLEWREKRVEVRRTFTEHTKRINSMGAQKRKVVSVGDEGKLVLRILKY